MNKFLVTVVAAVFCHSGFAEPAAYKKITLSIPNTWSIEGSVLHDGSGAKVGELTSKETWPYASGAEFISAFKTGFVDDPETTEFITSGSDKNIFWVCRSGEYEDGKGGGGIWYARDFWVQGPILTLYSHKSCDEKFDEALEIAKTVKEN